MKCYHSLMSLCILTAFLCAAEPDENYTTAAARQDDASAAVRCMELQAKGIAAVAVCVSAAAAGLYKLTNHFVVKPVRKSFCDLWKDFEQAGFFAKQWQDFLDPSASDPSNHPGPKATQQDDGVGLYGSSHYAPEVGPTISPAPLLLQPSMSVSPPVIATRELIPHPSKPVVLQHSSANTSELITLSLVGTLSIFNPEDMRTQIALLRPFFPSWDPQLSQDISTIHFYAHQNPQGLWQPMLRDGNQIVPSSVLIDQEAFKKFKKNPAKLIAQQQQMSLALQASQNSPQSVFPPHISVVQQTQANQDSIASQVAQQSISNNGPGNSSQQVNHSTIPISPDTPTIEGILERIRNRRRKFNEWATASSLISSPGRVLSPEEVNNYRLKNKWAYRQAMQLRKP